MRIAERRGQDPMGNDAKTADFFDDESSQKRTSSADSSQKPQGRARTSEPTPKRVSSSEREKNEQHRRECEARYVLGKATFTGSAEEYLSEVRYHRGDAAEQQLREDARALWRKQKSKST